MDCKYCLEPLSLNRLPLMLSCGHSICSRCLNGLRKKNKFFCPYDKKPEKRPETQIPIYNKQYNQLISNKSQVVPNPCPKHQLPLNFFSKKSYESLCFQCLKAEKISDTDLIEEKKIKQHLSNAFKQSGTESNISAYCDLLYDKVDDLKKFKTIINGLKLALRINQELYKKDLKFKLRELKNYKDFRENKKNIDITDIDNSKKDFEYFRSIINIYVISKGLQL